ncbi:ribosome biogenesis GTPase YlqF [Mesomycoplasma lagogenitalium]|uniref:Ribosome biogenesis GTPase A n=1 Tax=Mesomycoplasma lagogenitalium TaxID=171286 RepID=A0ABY8LU12_9BACT|nr:ribosome biogenesis GTPase YlqF [Mesomycoplasma lagogenitalium]WGI36730.1 ribosome biogenesis GTPase YlqF [Mesomycoplasma lagogenitalium]
MIQWFPGHMAKAIRQIKEKQVLVDLFLIVLDGRAPISSYNEEFDKIAPEKPRLFVITKSDMADKNKINTILKRFENNSSSKAILVNLKENISKKIILKSINHLLENKRKKDMEKGFLKPRLRVFVVGVPNSGKSTLINLIASAKTKVGDMPGVTKGQQWINAGDFQLLDTPGILWPKFDDQLIGIKLAIIGSIKPDIIPKKDFFNFGYKLLSQYYPEKILKLGLEPAIDETEIYNNLYKLGKLKLFLTKNNQPDLEKTMQWFIIYLRKLTNVTYD